MYYAAFLGSRRASAVQLFAAYISSFASDPADAFSSITFSSNGQTISSDGTSDYNWLSSGSAADFDIRATVTAGSFSSGTTGSWLNLATARAWTLSRTSPGTRVCTATFEISRAGQATAIATAVISLEAAVE